MSITPRKLKNGKTVFTAQVRVMRQGEKYSDSATFSSKAAAQAWEKRRKVELSAVDAEQLLKIKRAPREVLTGLVVIDRYTDGHKKIGGTTLSTLNLLKRFPLAEKDWTKLTAADFITFAQDAARGAKPAPLDPDNPTEADLIEKPRSPATVAGYLSALTTLMKHGGAPFNVRLPLSEIQYAKDYLKNTKVIGKSRKRNRRPTIEELNRLLDFFYRRWMEDKRRVPMHIIVLNQITGCNRQGETARGLWANYDEATGRMLIENMKHPRNKEGNDVHVRVLAEQARTIQAMPRTSERIFPYHGDTLGRLFREACKALNIVDLHFHDLRHEGISRLSECGLTIPEVSDVSGHMDWAGLKRYTHLRGKGDPYAGWVWIDRLMAGELDIKA